MIHITYITIGSAHNKHTTHILEVCSSALFQVNDCNYTDR
jgi:hypothetical protein